MKHLRKYVLFLLAFLIFATLIPTIGLAASAATMQLAKTEGDVSIKDDGGKTVAVRNNMKLYDGYDVGTASKSYAWINLDNTKMVKLDAQSDAVIKKDGGKLEIDVQNGKVFFNITEPLKSSESLNIRTATMVVGIRGTAGWVDLTSGGDASVSVLEGTVAMTVNDPATGQTITESVTGGETVSLNAAGQDGAGGISVSRAPLNTADVPGFVLKDVAESPQLAQTIMERSNGAVDLRAVTPEQAETKQQTDQAQQASEAQQTTSATPAASSAPTTYGQSSSSAATTYGASAQESGAQSGASYSTYTVENDVAAAISTGTLPGYESPNTLLNQQNVNQALPAASPTPAPTSTPAPTPTPTPAAARPQPAATPTHTAPSTYDSNAAPGTGSNTVPIGTPAPILVPQPVPSPAPAPTPAQPTPAPAPVYYNVTFDLGGLEDWGTIQVLAGQKVPLSEALHAPAPVNYTFGGWYTDAGFTQPWDMNNSIVNSNVTLHAKITPKAAAANQP